MIDLSSRTVILFGASGALGGALAEALLASGATLIGADLAVPSTSRSLPGVDDREVDVLSEDSVANLFNGLVDPPWAVLNTVGGFAGAYAIKELDLAQVSRQFDLNLHTAAIVTKHALRAMIPAREGRLVHTASRAAVVTIGTGFAYSASKLAVFRLVEMAAAYVHSSGITVNCVLPSIIDTPANRASMPGADFSLWPKPDELAQVYLFLASQESGVVSGAALPAYGAS